MKFMLHYMSKYKGLILLNLIGVFGFIIAELGIPTIVAHIVDNGIARNDSDYILQMFIYLIGVAIAGGLGRIVLSYCGARISSQIVRDIRSDIFAKTQEYSPVEYNKLGISSMITRTMPDAYIILQFVNMVLKAGLITPIMIVASFILVIETSFNLSMVIIGCLPIIIFGAYMIAKVSKPISQKQQVEMDNLNRITRENITGVRVIRAFRKSSYEQDRFNETSEAYTAQARKLYKIMSLTQPAFFIVLEVGMLFIFWISSNMISVGSLSVGQLMAFLEYMFHALFSTMLFANVFTMYPRAAISASRIQEMLDMEPAIRNPENPVTQGVEDTTLSFNNVSFQYPDGELPVLKNVSFNAGKGDTVAFIGSTGSGKSTLINLIPRFYDVSEGSVSVDGVDVRDYELKTLRRKVGFIPQKALLFSGTIAENIRFGKHDADEDELTHSAKTASAYDFIIEKPNQFDDCISEGGSNVSGGQKQRLSIARAVVRKPEIYIFDDSFSALDYKTDAEVRKNLAEETKDAITLIVAQRISSIMDATEILVLNEGEVVGQGTHKELLETCEVYKEIAYSQLSKEELSR